MGATILVADGNQQVSDSTEAILARSSYKVLVAGSGAAALEVLRAHPEVDLVLAEALLPGMSGSELVGEAKRVFPFTAAMLMTATDEALDPAITCIKKPFTTDELIKRVEEVLARSRQERETLYRLSDSVRQSIEFSRALRQSTHEARSEAQHTIGRSRQLRWERTLHQWDGQRPIVLVVEDDPAFRYAVSHFLSRKGFTVLDASNHAEARRLWGNHQERIDVLVTDLQGVDGLELAHVVESDRPGKPIIFMTASDVPLPYPTLRKPFELADLAAVVMQTLDCE